MISFKVPHLIHCLALVLCSLLPIISFSSSESASIDQENEYGLPLMLLLHLSNLQFFLGLPSMIFLFFGLMRFNVFSEKVELKGSPLLPPVLCFRVVTRGDYPNLVNDNIRKNIQTCYDAGLEHFIFEVVTDKAVNVNKNSRAREIVVPNNYQTRTGALFKARALQYCLEDDVNNLNDNDWVVHLDEETLLSVDSVRGILNFVMDGKHQFGQGLITYAQGNVVNWITTLIDSLRVATDVGMIRFQLKALNKPWFGIKGSFIVAQHAAEQDVGFENGPEGSITEDAIFAMRSMEKGYTFDWIEGEMYEKSPFTFMDLVRQRKRWMEGLLLNVHSSDVHWKYKLAIATSVYANLLSPVTAFKIVLCFFYPMSSSYSDGLCLVLGSIGCYSVLLGLAKSVPLHRAGIFRSLGLAFASLLVLPLHLLSYSIAVMMLLVSHKQQFYVVQK